MRTLALSFYLVVLLFDRKKKINLLAVQKIRLTRKNAKIVSLVFYDV